MLNYIMHTYVLLSLTHCFWETNAMTISLSKLPCSKNLRGRMHLKKVCSLSLDFQLILSLRQNGIVEAARHSGNSYKK